MRWTFVLVWTWACGKDGGVTDSAGSTPTGTTPPTTAVCELEACGGDLVGTWAQTTSCAYGSLYLPPPFCPTMTIEDHGSTSFATNTFNPDGTCFKGLDYTTDKTNTYPPECLATAGMDSCAPLESTGGQTTTTCTGDAATGCVCHTVGGGQTGFPCTYTTDGNRWEIQDGGILYTGEYCVEGTTLRWLEDYPEGYQITDFARQ